MAGDRDRRSRVFPAAVASVPVARRWARQVLSAWQLGPSDAELALSEMITNAVVHGSGEVHADLTRVGSGVRLEVHDQGEASPAVFHHPAHDQSGGRGLEIVSRLAINWGWNKLPPGGTTVWALIPGSPFDTT